LTALEDDSAELLKALKAALPTLRDLLAGLSGRGYEDPIYRFYHHSYKVFDLQNRTDEIVSTLRKLLPQRDLNPLFLEIVAQGTGKEFSLDQNADWTSHTRNGSPLRRAGQASEGTAKWLGRIAVPLPPEIAARAKEGGPFEPPPKN
jgi:hypothetical protein